jgi:hypothetical protein
MVSFLQFTNENLANHLALKMQAIFWNFFKDISKLQQKWSEENSLHYI